MRDEEYRPADIAAYGAHEQPALVSRTSQHLRTTLIGVGVAAVGLVLGVIGVVGYPDLEGAHVGRGWVVGLLWCQVAMLVVCLWQHLSWRRATQVWHGERDDDLGALVAVSWVLHLVSYAVVAIAVVLCVVALVELGWYASTAVLVVLSLLGLIAAQVLAGVQHVRAAGPPGAAPARMRVTDR